MSSSGSSGGLWNGVLERAQEAADTSWTDLALPSWLVSLKNVRGNLIEFGRDPKGFILGVIAVFLIEQFLGFVTAVFAFILQVFDLLAGIPVTITNSFLNSGQVIAGGFWAIGGAIYWPLLGAINALGWTAPLVFALLFVLVLEVTEEASLPLASALSDLLGAIPVVGSILDAILTLVINLVRRVGGDS